MRVGEKGERGKGKKERSWGQSITQTRRLNGKEALPKGTMRKDSIDSSFFMPNIAQVREKIYRKGEEEGTMRTRNPSSY